MNVQTLIDILLKEVKKPDRKNAEIEFYIGGQSLDIDTMSGFSLSPNIVINFKKIKSHSLELAPAVFKAEHKQMIAKKTKEILNEQRRSKKTTKRTSQKRSK
jgi:hypothetical protein